MLRRENFFFPLPRRQHFREKIFRCPFRYPKVPLEAGAPPNLLMLPTPLIEIQGSSDRYCMSLGEGGGEYKSLSPFGLGPLGHFFTANLHKFTSIFKYIPENFTRSTIPAHGGPLEKLGPFPTFLWWVLHP